MFVILENSVSNNLKCPFQTIYKVSAMNKGLDFFFISHLKIRTSELVFLFYYTIFFRVIHHSCPFSLLQLVAQCERLFLGLKASPK